MISTEKQVTSTQFHFDNQPKLSTKKRLEARWEKVDDKLVCRWVEV
jgi:hypothetical protein